MENNNENVIEFISGERYIGVTFTERKWINRVKKLYIDRKDEFKYYRENEDGSVYVRIPKRWLKLNPGSKPDPNKPKRTRTPEQIEAATKALAKWREENKKNK